MQKPLKKQVLEFIPLPKFQSQASRIVESFETQKFLAKIVELNNRMENEPELDEYLEKMMAVFKIHYSSPLNFERAFLNPENSSHAKIILESSYKDLVLEFSRLMTIHYRLLHQFLISVKKDETSFIQVIKVIFSLLEAQIDGDPAIYNQSKQMVANLAKLENEAIQTEKSKIIEESDSPPEETSNPDFIFDDIIFLESFRQMLKSNDSIIRMRGMELICSLADELENISQNFYEAKLFSEIVRIYSEKEDDLLESLNVIDILSNFVSIKELQREFQNQKLTPVIKSRIFDRERSLVLRQFNCCLYLELLNNFLCPFEKDFYAEIFMMCKKAFEYNEISFSLEILTRVLISKQGIGLLKKNPGFWGLLKRKLSMASNQQVKEKLIQIVELGVASKKVDFKDQTVTPFFVDQEYPHFLYFIFFDEIPTNLTYGNHF